MKVAELNSYRWIINGWKSLQLLTIATVSSIFDVGVGFQRLKSWIQMAFW